MQFFISILIILFPYSLLAQKSATILQKNTPEQKAVNNNVSKDISEAKIVFSCRAGKTIDSTNHPLLIIDNVVTKYSSLPRLNPQNIQSVEVIKGKASTALYGSEGINGAIIITLKPCEKIEKKPSSGLIL